MAEESEFMTRGEADALITGTVPSVQDFYREPPSLTHPKK
jgi:hypothetical protein